MNRSRVGILGVLKTFPKHRYLRYQVFARRFGLQHDSRVDCNTSLTSGARWRKIRGNAFPCTLRFQPFHSVQNGIVCVSRRITTEDIQMFEILHGGVYVELSEEAGDMIIQKYCNELNNLPTVIPVVKRIEKIQFLDKGLLGEIVTAEGKLIYTAPQSLRVFVSIFASPFVDSDKKKLIARSWLWYELLDSSNLSEALPVLPLKMNDTGLEEEGRFELEKHTANAKNHVITGNTAEEYDHPAGTVSSRIIMGFMCGWKPFSSAGPLVKWMDELAGSTAIRFAKRVCVTGSCENVNFYTRVMPGSCATVTAMPVFSRGATVDIQCLMHVETASDGHVVKELAAEAYFAYVAIKNKSEKGIVLPQMVPKTEQQKIIYDQRLAAYEQRKQSYKSKKSMQEKSS